MTENKKNVETYMEGFRTGDNGDSLDAVFCNVFLMQNGKIKN